MGPILVTGGAGYVGSVLVRALVHEGRDVRVLDLLPTPCLHPIRGDVTVASDRRAALEGIESVIHLAAVVGDGACATDPATAWAVNVDATRHLIDECVEGGVCNFVFVSTCSNYGIHDPDELAAESSVLNPVSIYARSKVAGEEYLLSRASPAFAPTVLRLATVYGVSPRMRFDLTVNQFARDAALGRPLVIYGERFWRPYVHVQDVALAVRLTLASDAAVRAGEVFNVGHTNENYQKAILAELLQRRFPSLRIEYRASGSDQRSYRVSFEKISRILRFQPAWTVPDGIDEVIRLVEADRAAVEIALETDLA